MATKKADKIDAEPESTDDEIVEEAPAKSRFGGGYVKILALLTVVMVGEAGLFYFLGLGPAAEPKQAGAEESKTQDEELTKDNAQSENVEVEVDTFNISNNRAAADAVVHVTFEFVALVSRDQEQAFDEASNKMYKARVRQAIIKVIRSSSLEDLNDPNLSTIKRLLREEVNKVLRQSYIIEVVISDFKTMEQ